MELDNIYEFEKVYIATTDDVLREGVKTYNGYFFTDCTHPLQNAYCSESRIKFVIPREERVLQ